MKDGSTTSTVWTRVIRVIGHKSRVKRVVITERKVSGFEMREDKKKEKDQKNRGEKGVKRKEESSPLQRHGTTIHWAFVFIYLRRRV